MNTLRRERLLDELVEAYVAWREACAHVHDAYRFWANEPAGEDGVTFDLYMRRSTRKSGPRGSTPDSSGAPTICPGARILRSNHSAGRCGDLTGHDSCRARWPRHQWVSHPRNS
jgi:hypothetical protein